MRTVFLLICVNDNDLKLLCEKIKSEGNAFILTKCNSGKVEFNKDELLGLTRGQIGIYLCGESDISKISVLQTNNQNIQFIAIGINIIINNTTKIIGDNTRKSCSIILSGNEESLLEQIEVLTHLFVHGGVISGKDLEVLLRNNQLINKVILDENKIECASYNLHLGNKYKNSDKKRNNRMLDASENDNLIEIKPYSYIIVHPKEEIQLPTFVTAKFDLTVGMFQKGLILSASTQVDPGFYGYITCLLYNPSDTSITLKVSDEFLTIEFYTTTYNTIGYNGKRKFKSLEEQLAPDAIKKSSNKLSKITKENSLKWLFKEVIVPLLSILIPCIFSYCQCRSAKEEVESLQSQINLSTNANSNSNESENQQFQSTNIYINPINPKSENIDE